MADDRKTEQSVAMGEITCVRAIPFAKKKFRSLYTLLPRCIILPVCYRITEKKTTAELMPRN